MTLLPHTVLVVGARGFVGRALVPALVRAGHTVRCGVRRVPSEPAPEGASWVQVDVDDETAVRAALGGTDVAIWLVHGLKRGGDYPAWERDVAERFSVACAARGVARIVYLGGVAPRDATTRHLESRHASGRALATHVPLVELKAGMIIGAGSESWCVTRDAVARLPMFLLPPWLAARQQPVAIDDVVAALVAACDLPCGTYDVPGPEVLSGEEIVRRTATHLGRRPWFVRVPGLSRSFAARVAPFVTRADAVVVHELFAGLGIDFVTHGSGVFAFMPGHRRTPFDEAVVRALAADDVPLGAQLYEAAVRRLSELRA